MKSVSYCMPDADANSYPDNFKSFLQDVLKRFC